MARIVIRYALELAKNLFVVRIVVAVLPRIACRKHAGRSSRASTTKPESSAQAARRMPHALKAPLCARCLRMSAFSSGSGYGSHSASVRTPNRRN